MVGSAGVEGFAGQDGAALAGLGAGEGDAAVGGLGLDLLAGREGDAGDVDGAPAGLAVCG